MKLIVNSTIAFVAILFFASCEKVIDPRLDNAEKKYVIEGNINNNPGSCKVRITQTKNFIENNDFPGVSGAMVTVSDNGGLPIPLNETSKGNYETTIINGTSGHTYNLSVAVGGKIFTSSSTMPPRVALDSVYIEDRPFFGDSAKIVYVNYKDPLISGNAYHFIQYKNNVQETTVFVTNDDYTNGNKVTTPLFSFTDEEDKKIKSGDTIKVVMECIDAAVYKYWYSIDAASGASNNATPANPVSNITGGALGYFSAHTTQSRSVVVR